MNTEYLHRKYNVGKRLFSFSLVCFCLFILSCSHEDELSRTVVQAEEVLIDMSLPVPFTKKISSRAQTEQEALLNEFQVFVFEGGVYKYKAVVKSVNPSGSSTTCQATLKTSSNRVNLIVLGNVDNLIAANEPQANVSLTDFRESLTLSYTGTGMAAPFPMSGEYEFANGLTTAHAGAPITISMLRSVARADFYINESVTNFELSSVEVFRANSEVQVMPDALVSPSSPSVDTPSVPDASGITVRTTALTVSGNTVEEMIYLPESNAAASDNRVTGATCLVVGGSYNGGTVSYYRVDFNAGDPAKFGEILRNHRYIFRLTSVNDHGYDSPEEAANNLPTGTTFEVENWDEATHYMGFGEGDYFSLSARVVTLRAHAGASYDISIDTNLDSYSILASDASGSGDPASGGTSAQGSIYRASLLTVDGTPTLRIEALTDNTNNHTEADYLVIFADKWKILIEIRQDPGTDISNAFVHILSLGTGIGNLGNLIPVNNGNAGGIKPILLNIDNFGPHGIVPFGGFTMTVITDSDFNNRYNTPEVIMNTLRGYDIINVMYNNDPGSELSQYIMDWLNEDERRVLIISNDNNRSNSNLIDLIEEGTAMWDGGGTDTFNFAGHTFESSVFTQNGPFGALSLESGQEIINRYDGTWEGLKSDHPYAANVVPLIVSAGSGVYVVSVDKTKRIVFIGDSNMMQDRTPGMDGSGTINSDAAILFANIFAWAIEDVILKTRP